MITCPCCGSHMSGIELDQLRYLNLPKLQRQVLDALIEAYPVARPLEDLASRVWALDPNGGPETAILKQEEAKPYLRRLLYIQGIIRKRSRAYRYDCLGYLEHLVLNGFDIDDLEARAKRLRSIKEFEAPLDEWLDSIGEPY